MNLRDYLNRIGIKEIKKPSLEFLSELQNRHLLSIPFEDLDIPQKRIELDLTKIYDKIISSKRGGFCYELNGLYHWLLTSLGFEADMLSARVFNTEQGTFGPDYDHMTLLVHLEKDYLTDAGFGDSFRFPVELPEGEVVDISGHYRIVKKSKEQFELKKENGEDWETQYSFTTIPGRFSDYKDMCDFQQDNPSSHFRMRMLCTIATEPGRITLSNNSLTIKENGNKTKINFETPDKFLFYLKKYFGIVV